MSKESVIALRDALKGGKNLPLRVYGDNNFVIVDESLPFQFTKWDDTNGILYTFRLMSMDQTVYPSNVEQSISVAGILYDFIQVMENVPLSLGNLDSVFTSMESSGISFGTNFKDKIKHVFTEALHPDRWGMTPEHINNMHGDKVRADFDSYYAGKFKENFKETRDYALRNNEIDEANNNNTP